MTLFLQIICAVLAGWAFYVFLKVNGLLPKQNVKDKHVFLTGAGSGLGRGMAVEFGKLGAKLTLCDINEKGLEETKKLMLQDKSIKDENILLVQLDVSNRDAITEAS